jgi:hypothetical protein
MGCGGRAFGQQCQRSRGLRLVVPTLRRWPGDNAPCLRARNSTPLRRYRELRHLGAGGEHNRASARNNRRLRLAEPFESSGTSVAGDEERCRYWPEPRTASQRRRDSSETRNQRRRDSSETRTRRLGQRPSDPPLGEASKARARGSAPAKGVESGTPSLTLPSGRERSRSGRADRALRGTRFPVLSWKKAPPEPRPADETSLGRPNPQRKAPPEPGPADETSLGRPNPRRKAPPEPGPATVRTPPTLGPEATGQGTSARGRRSRRASSETRRGLQGRRLRTPTHALGPRAVPTLGCGPARATAAQPPSGGQRATGKGRSFGTCRRVGRTWDQSPSGPRTQPGQQTGAKTTRPRAGRRSTRIPRLAPARSSDHKGTIHGWPPRGPRTATGPAIHHSSE